MVGGIEGAVMSPGEKAGASPGAASQAATSAALRHFGKLRHDGFDGERSDMAASVPMRCRPHPLRRGRAGPSLDRGSPSEVPPAMG